MKVPSRRFIVVDYQDTLLSAIVLQDILPETHLARFIVGLVEQLDMSIFYQHYSNRGGTTYAPQILLALLLYAYATGVFSSRKIERATYESIPFRYIAGHLHPDHDTIATFRKRFLSEFRDVFVQVLLQAQDAGILNLEDISQDGTKVHANASKSKAVSYKRLLELQQRLEKEVDELFELSAKLDQGNVSELPEHFDMDLELSIRLERLVKYATAKDVLEQRAAERYEVEKKEYDARQQAREEKKQKTGKNPRGRKPKAPVEGPRDKDQYNFTDPESRIMKNSKDKGFDQHYNGQIGVEHESMLIVGNSLSNHTNDKQEVEPLLDRMEQELGTPKSAAMDNGYFSEANIKYCLEKGIEPYIATGRNPHHNSWKKYFEQQEEPGEDASPTVKMAHKLKSEVGQAIYRLRKCTVEPVIGIIKGVLGFRQFSLRGLEPAAGEWNLVCLAYNVKRLHVILAGQGFPGNKVSPTGC